MTNTAKRRAAAQIDGVKSKSKPKKKDLKITRRSRLTNGHLPELFQDINKWLGVHWPKQEWFILLLINAILCIHHTCKMQLLCVRFIASCKLRKSLGQGPDSGPFPWIKMISYDIPVSSLYTSEKGFFMLPYFTSHNATSIMFVILTHNPCSYELKQHACCHGGLISRCIRTDSMVRTFELAIGIGH